ncbi:C1 family peptidase [Marinicaulis aureus]|uniref:C1 family peptidase n=1 Tax=Hyphococcus aureus TaxID=2666033 RepID=A0ABW1L1F5_9PROT
MTEDSIKIDLRNQFGDADNQGRRPTCLAFAASAAHRYCHAAEEPFCVEWLYFYAVTRAGDPPDAGSRIPDTTSVIRDIGQPVDAHWPYSVADPDPGNWRPPPTAPNDIFVADNDDADSRYDDISAALAKGVPTIIGLKIGNSFIHTIKNGEHALVDDDPEPVAQGAGHALLVVGAGLIESRNRLLVRNSWGPRWGDLGHAWITENYMNDRWMGGFRLKEKKK